MYDDEPIECAVCGALIGPDEEHTSKHCTAVIRQRYEPVNLPEPGPFSLIPDEYQGFVAVRNRSARARKAALARRKRAAAH